MYPFPKHFFIRRWWENERFEENLQIFEENHKTVLLSHNSVSYTCNDKLCTLKVMNIKNIITWLFFRIKHMRTDIMAAKI